MGVQNCQEQLGSGSEENETTQSKCTRATGNWGIVICKGKVDFGFEFWFFQLLVIYIEKLFNHFVPQFSCLQRGMRITVLWAYFTYQIEITYLKIPSALPHTE